MSTVQMDLAMRAVNLVALRYGVSWKELEEDGTRKFRAVLARWVAGELMHLAGIHDEQIGLVLNRQRTTVLHGRKALAEFLSTSPKERARFDETKRDFLVNRNN